jgi:hypothetical protein
MPKSWYIVMIILGIVLFIVCTVMCKICYRDHKKMLELIEPVRSNRVYPMPVAIGVEVYGPQRGVQVITVENV